MLTFKDKKIALLGWGINGLDAYKYLRSHGANITVFDEKSSSELDLTGVDNRDVKFSLGRDYLKKGIDNFDYIFRAPGVYRYLPQIIQAEKKGVKVTSAVKLFFDMSPARIIGVTGTKGKGTTSTLIYEIVKKDRDAYLAGNIGAPMLELLPSLNVDSWVILELSSFQLIDLHKSPHIAVVLNITEDHLDWHKNRDEYVRAKLNIVKHQKRSDFTILAYDYDASKSFSDKTEGNVFYFSRSEKVKGAYVKNGGIYLSVDKTTLIGNTDSLLLRGRHNWENVCAAACASSLAGSGLESIKKSVFSFKGLEHRLEHVGTVGEIAFYNDSFSTNPQTTLAAVNSFIEPITLILGGSDKGLQYDELGQGISDSKNIKSVVLIGYIAPIIRKSLVKAGFKGKIIPTKSKSMNDILKICLKNTKKGGVVLLSPATASFDMFANYKERGKKFKEAVDFLKQSR